MTELNDDILSGFHESMEGYCLELLHQGYLSMLTAKGYDVDWKEDKLTVHYIEHMMRLEMRKMFQISIIPQAYLYTYEHAFGEDEVEKAPRIDFKFSRWEQKEEVDYFAEAKNLSEKNWTKKNGKPVNASYYYKRYIETGISHLLTNYYPNNCVLIGYVLNGNKSVILSNLNNLISLNFGDYGCITKPETTSNDEFYISENEFEKKKIIKHMFLQLYTQEHKRNDEIIQIIKAQRKKVDKATIEQKSRIEQQIILLEHVKNEIFQGEAGVLRINLAWNTIDDLDLHVETKEGEISYEKKELGLGKLDVDANANEPLNKNPQENVVFIGQPNSKCKVKVNFFEKREDLEVDFVISVLTPNDEIKVLLKTVNFENQKMIDVLEFEFDEGGLIITEL
jgi:hypothetical protein